MFENGRCTLPIEMECWSKSDCCWVEMTLATPTCWGFCRILYIGVSLVGWVKFSECGQLLHGKRFLIRLKEAVCKRYVILYGSEAFSLEESEMGIL